MQVSDEVMPANEEIMPAIKSTMSASKVKNWKPQPGKKDCETVNQIAK